MKKTEVIFSYYSDGSSASDTFHFSDETAAQEKFSQLRDVIEHNFADVVNPEVIIEVDGGVDTNNHREIVKAGANALVAGSAVFGAEKPTEAIAKLKTL